MGNRFIDSPVTIIISLEIWKSPGELLKGARQPGEGPRGNVYISIYVIYMRVCVCV